jgi:NAD/NADP transhydrogenase alpha subunit
MAFHASQMYARTVTNFLMHLFQDGKIHLDPNDEMTRATLVTHQGQIVSEPLKAILGLGPRVP